MAQSDFAEKIENDGLQIKPFELRPSIENVDSARVTELLDCATYYTLMNMPLPSNRDAIIHNMIDEQFIREMDNGNYFTDFTEVSFGQFIHEILGIKIVEYWISEDVRPGRSEEKWLNVILQKSDMI